MKPESQEQPTSKVLSPHSKAKRYLVPLVVFALSFAGIGSVIVLTRASTFMTHLESETGNQAGGVSRCVDESASGGQAIRFGGPPCQTFPGGQFVNWQSTANSTGGAWQRLAKLADGSWLRVRTNFPSAGRTDLIIYKSTDNAHTWSQISTVDDGDRLVDNGFLYLAPNGDVLLAGRNNVPGSSYKISQWRSVNQGLSWQRETDVASASGDNGGLWEPSYYTVGTQVIAMWSDETQDGLSQVISQRISSDNGLTWGDRKTVVADGASGRPGMQSVAKMTNGSYIMVFEVCGTQACANYSKISANGLDWPSGIGSPIPGTTCGPYIVSLQDGRLAATACRISDNNFTVPLVYSEDFGATWKTNPTPPFIDGGQYGGWPALYQIAPDELMAVSDVRTVYGTVAPR